jgi:hypothetical protein
MTGDVKNSVTQRRAIRRLARRVLSAFVLTFIISRVVAFLIMSRRIPDLFVHLGGTHIHHLNYGIFLLAAVGAYLLFRRPVGRGAEVAAVLYGIGLGLTFDEFGMWLHLGGGYWQRASWDAVIVIAAVLGLIAFAPSLKRFRPHHWWVAAAVAVAVVVFFLLLLGSFRFAGRVVGPRLREIESTSPQ